MAILFSANFSNDAEGAAACIALARKPTASQ